MIYKPEHADRLNEPVPVYRHAQSAPERNQVRSEHAEWSQAAFGNVGPVGPLKHLSKEALEAAAEPDDLSEWADMQFLLWDAQRRAGITDEQITQAMIEKLAVNKQREWPEPKDGEPRLHIKAQQAPVVSADLLHTAASAIEDLLTTKDRTGAGVWFGLPGELRRAAMLQPLHTIKAASSLGSLPKTGEVLHTNSPVIPDTWIPVSERMPENEVDVQIYCPGSKEQMVGYLERNEQEGYFRYATWRTGDGIYCQPSHWMPLPSGPQEVKGE
ncbi:TPA: dATP/dGTP pyrophosphohydrolase domain-containing protein [Klebsiella aerogenes]